MGFSSNQTQLPQGETFPPMKLLARDTHECCHVSLGKCETSV